MRNLRSNRRSLNLNGNLSGNLNGLHHTGEEGEMRSVEDVSRITNSGEQVTKEEEEEKEDTGKASLVHL